MYDFKRKGQFKKDFKTIVRRKYDIQKLETVLILLRTTNKLPPEYKEHPLKGNFKKYLDCHIEDDWLLIFQRNEDEKIITLVRTGSHQDLFE